MRASIVSLLTASPLALAHFKIEYPAWRGDSLAENTTYDQWQYPCMFLILFLHTFAKWKLLGGFKSLTVKLEKGAGVPYASGNRTDWPIEGGSIALNLHHEWSYLYINLGLGENTTDFNLSLTPELLNVTGSGNFCIPALPIPATVLDGQNATIQIVTNDQSGSALYNVSRLQHHLRQHSIDVFVSD
jgi:hypothetical protein